MVINIHPIFTHFPIALLTLYSFFELLRFKKLLNWQPWWYIKATFCIFGTGIGYATYFTGTLLEDAYEGSRLLEMHELWGIITLTFFTLVSIAQLVRWLELTGKCSASSKLCRWLSTYARYVFTTPVMLVVGLFGLLTITISGALGGALAYGPEVDPVVKLVYRLIVGE